MRILGIPGSLRAASTNRGLLRAAQELAPSVVEIEAFELGAIPLYDGDVEPAGDPDPDVSWKTLSVTADPERAVVRSKMSGTHLGEYQGIAGTGRSFEVDTIDFLQISDGKIVQNDVFFDGLEVLRQLGLMPPSNSRTEKVMRGAFNTLTRLRRRFVTARR
ncbi:MAG: ester cyclase [Actinobacteria bacterium]|nr:ester cyclase [Actinomycetota bacterium]